MNHPSILQPEERGDAAEGTDVAAEGQDVLAVEGAILHPDLELPAVLQEGDVAHHGDGRLHIQAQALGGEKGRVRGRLYRVSHPIMQRGFSDNFYGVLVGRYCS